MKELTEIAGDPSFAFNNLTLATIDEFTTAFRRVTIGEQCEYLRGLDGAQIDCLPDAVQIGITLGKATVGRQSIDIVAMNGE